MLRRYECLSARGEMTIHRVEEKSVIVVVVHPLVTFVLVLKCGILVFFLCFSLIRTSGFSSTYVISSPPHSVTPYILVCSVMVDCLVSWLVRIS